MINLWLSALKILKTKNYFDVIAAKSGFLCWVFECLIFLLFLEGINFYFGFHNTVL